VKKRLTIGIVGAVLAATLTFVAASSVKREQVTEADALPAYEVLTSVRSMGFNPISEPVRRGPYYVLNATDARGVEMRVVADAQVGEILSIAPAQASNNTPHYERGPRIIHVPQPGERNDRVNDRASVNDRDEPAATSDDDDEAASPPRRRVAPLSRTTPRWPSRSDPPLPPQRRSDTPPPPPGPRRAVLSAPPAEGPTPVRPTPRYNSKADSGDKFGTPRDITSSPPPPPVGYSPPAALPQADQSDPSNQ
jgi:hypothetical protein